MKKNISAFLAMIITIGICTTANASMFADIDNHWAEDTIIKWGSKGIILGYNGNFYPDDFISRADIAVIIDKMNSFDKVAENTFSDLDSDKYYTEPVLRVNAAGIMLGYGDSIRPTGFVTRQEAVVLLYRAYAMKGEIISLEYTDKNDIADWAYEAISTMTSKKYIRGFNNYFCPQNNITRAEFITILNNISNDYEEEKIQEFDTTDSKSGVTFSGKSGSGRKSGGSAGKVETEKTEETEEVDEIDENFSIGKDDLFAGGIY